MKKIIILFAVLSAGMMTLKAQLPDTPMFIRSGATTDPMSKKTITWMTDQVTTPQAKMKLAKKIEGTGSFVVYTGKTMNISYDTHYSGVGTNPKIPKTAYSVTVEGLEPGTTYIYQVGNGTVWSEIQEFTTAKPTNKFSFFVLSDLQAFDNNIMDITEGGTSWLRTIADMYKNPSTRPLFTIQTGDLVNREYVYNFYSKFGNVCNDHPEFANTDMLFAIGDKEYAGGNIKDALTFTRSGRGNIAKFLNGTPAINAGDIGSGTYSVDYGNVHVITLDCAGRNGASSDTIKFINALAAWLHQDLMNCDKPWKIVSLHYPVFIDGEAHPYRSVIETALGTIFADYGVQLVFSGHFHKAKRIQKNRSGGTLKNGLNSTPDVLPSGAPSGPIYVSCGALTDNIDQTIINHTGFSTVYVKCDVDDHQMTVTMTNQYNMVRDKFTIKAIPKAIDESALSSATVTFESLNPQAGKLEAYTGGSISGLGAGNTFPPITGKLIDGASKLSQGSVKVKDGAVFFVATPEPGWRVKWFEVNGQACANRVGGNYIPIDKTTGISSGSQIVASGNCNIGILDNSAPGFACGVSTYNAASMGTRNATEIIKVAVASGGSVNVKVEFEKELALYSAISVSAVHTMNGAGAHNFFPSKYGVVVGPAAWWPGANSTGSGVNDWIEFGFENGVKEINEVRLYTRTGTNRATEVRLDFYRTGVTGTVHTQTVNISSTGGGTANIIKLTSSVLADKLRITQTKVDTGGSGAGFQRVQIVESVTPVSSVIVSSVANSPSMSLLRGTANSCFALQMQAEISPSNATNQSVTWSLTPATGVAEINADGLLTAVANGTVTVRATANDGSGKYGEKVITISGQPVCVSSIAVTGAGGASTITTSSGTLQMSAAITPSTATDKSVTWSTIPATGIASISSTGLLTAVGNGTVIVRATANDCLHKYGEKMITVSGQSSNRTFSISINGIGGVTDITEEGGSLQIEAIIMPTNASTNLAWSITPSTGIATISSKGMLTAIANGKVKVKATAQDGSKTESNELLISISNQKLGIQPTIANFLMLDGEQGTSYFQFVTTTGDRPMNWSIGNGSLPDGLTIDPATGLISGKPTMPGEYPFTVNANNDIGADQKLFILKVIGGATACKDMIVPELKLYPNPVRANDEFTVVIEGSTSSQGLIELFNSTGVSVMKTQTAGSMIRLTAPDRQGVYLLRFTKDGYSKTYRVIVY